MISEKKSAIDTIGRFIKLGAWKQPDEQIVKGVH